MGIVDKYKTRLSVRGKTERERLLNNEKRDLLINAPNSLSCKDVLISNEERKLIIDSGTKPYYKQICSLPNETFYAGEYVIYQDTPWLIINADWDDEVYTDGNMQQCNYEMKWQNEFGEIVTRQAVILSASQYNMGEEATKTITLGYNQLMVYMPLDDETIKLKSDKRFFIDNNTVQPKPYKLTRVDTVTMTYQGVGCILLVLTEDQYNADADRVDLMLCDYITTEAEIPDTDPLITITYKGNPTIRIGGSKTFKSDGVSVIFSIIVSDMFKNMISLKQLDDYTCKITIDNNSILVGSSFKLIATDNNGNTSDKLITVMGGV